MKNHGLNSIHGRTKINYYVQWKPPWDVSPHHSHVGSIQQARVHKIPLHYMITLAMKFCFWKSGSKQIPLHHLVTLAMRVCFRCSRSWQNQLSILISIIRTIFVIARPVYWNKMKASIGGPWPQQAKAKITHRSMTFCQLCWYLNSMQLCSL